MDEDARYRTSSQFRNWSFTPESLYALRSQTNSLAIERVKQSFARRALNAASQATTAVGTPSAGTPAYLGVDGSTPAPSGANTPMNGAAPPVDEIQFLAVEEELKLLRVFGVKVLEIGDHLKLPTDIKATALQFFHRFYLHNSFMSYPPIPILKTCLFLGCKAEHYNLPLSHFCRELSKTTPEDVLGPEFLLTQSLKFNLDVRHPFRALEGGVMEVMSIVGGAPALPSDDDDAMEGVEGGSDMEDRVRTAHGRARESLKTQALLTDVYFHYTPSQIMLASLYLADAELVQWYLNLKFPDHIPSGSEMRQKVLSTAQSCAQMMASVRPLVALGDDQMRELKVLNKKLRRCQDPEKADMAKLKQERQEKRGAMDREEEERKAKKRKMEKEVLGKEGEALFGKPLKKDGSDDPFGGGPSRALMKDGGDDPFGGGPLRENRQNGGGDLFGGPLPQK